MNAWPFQSELTLTAMPGAAYWARRHAEEVMKEWKLDGLMESVQLVVTELVTNAVKATGEMTPEVKERYGTQPMTVSYMELVKLGQVRLRLSYDYVRVVVEVWDRSEAVPVMQAPTEDAESGRGLLIVATYCTRWGWYPLRGTAPGRQGGRRREGKVVWGEVKVR
jgi:hypothetical protein